MSTPFHSSTLDGARTNCPEKLILASVGLQELSPMWKVNSLNQSILSPKLEVKEYAPHELYFKI